MSNARNQLILVGFLCQGLVWDSLSHWAISGALWFLALGPLRPRIRAAPAAELAALIGGSILSFAVAKAFGKSAHFFLGDGVICVQLARMLRPLSRGEKLASVLIACFHIAVGCTIAPDFRFFALAIAAMILLPKSLAELEAEEFGEARPAAGWGVILPAAILAILAFIVMPRLSLGAPIHLGGASQQAGLLSSMLDPANSGAANSHRVLLQIEGENIGYLKAMALNRFDGETWQLDRRPGLRRMPALSEGELERLDRRRVRVKNVAFLGRVLPVDGRPFMVKGKFFQKPFLNAHGVIECESVWNTANNQYEYWTERRPFPQPMSENMIEFFTAAPEPSPRIRQLMQTIARGTTNQFQFAEKLAGFLRSQYTYRLGAPALNRATALEDFLFVAKEGHCERFASAMALLLRMNGIPSRVAIGYVPGPKSRFSDWRPVRFSDAHSWTEAWFPDKGWIPFDGTPGGPRSVSEGFGVRQWIEAVDLLWYAHVISFDGASQRQLASGLAKSLVSIPLVLRDNTWLLLLFIPLAAIPLLRRRQKSKHPAATGRKTSQADHYYAKMLRILERAGYTRAPHQTPLEFLASLDAQGVPGLDAVEKLTRAFCAYHYGEAPIPNEASAELAAALREVESALVSQNASAR